MQNSIARLATLILAPALAVAMAAAPAHAAGKKLVQSSGPLHVTIPDLGVATKKIVVKKAGKITDIDVVLAAKHNEISDLSFYLQSPKGKVIHLSSGNGGSGSGYGTNDSDTGCTETMRFDDEADTNIRDYEGIDSLFSGAYQPESLHEFIGNSGLTGLDGTNMKGTWTLIASDTAEIGSGLLECVKLKISYAPIG